jgi:hypothetical protein
MIAEEISKMRKLLEDKDMDHEAVSKEISYLFCKLQK